jgi:hypothetical protein
MMKDFILNWRASVQRDVLNENKILHEASEEEIEVIEDVLSDLDPAKLPMNDAFGGKLRKVIPFEAVSGKIGEMVNALGQAGYQVDLKNGTVSYETEREHEGKVYKSKKTLKINKLLGGLLKHKEKQDDIYYKMQKPRQVKFNYDSTRAEKLKADEELTKLNRDLEQLNQVGKKAYRGMDKWMHKNSVKKYLAAWEEKAGFFKNNPEAFAGFSIIASRHPVDVLRMSDFDDITSCHTLASRSGERGTFIKCAYAEAIDGGAIAYVVPTEDIKDFEEEYGPLEDATDEVLVDEMRGIGSIDPVSRIRIRVGRFGEEDVNHIGVPDRKVYGAEMSNFYETLKDWLVKSQEKVIEKLPRFKESDIGDKLKMYSGRKIGEEHVGKIKAKDLTPIGGTYQDNPFVQNLASLLDPEIGLRGEVDVEKTVAGDPGGFESSENEIEVPDGGSLSRLQDEIEEEAEDWNRRMEYISMEADVEDSGDGPQIDAAAYLSIPLGLDDLDEDEDFTDTGRNELRHNGREYAKYIFQELENMGIEWARPDGYNLSQYTIAYLHSGDFELRAMLRPGEDLADYIYDVDTFNDFGSALEWIDNNVDDLILPTALSVLRREEVLVGNKVDEFYRRMQDDPYDETDWTFDYMPEEGRIDVDLDDIPANIDQIRGLEEIYYDNDVIRELMNLRDFRILFKQLLFDQIPQFVQGESMYPRMSRGYTSYSPIHYGISFSLDNDDPEGQFESVELAVLNIDKEKASDILKKTYEQIAKQDKKYKKQQEFPFGKEEVSEKRLNERLHRNWYSYLNSK